MMSAECRLIFISLPILLLALATGAVNIMTPLFKRCSNSSTYNRRYKCIEISNYGCQAQRIPSGYFNHSRYQCSEDCPPSPEDIRVIGFKQARYINGKIFTGVNITWTVSLPNQGHTSNLNLEGFRLELKSQSKRQIVSVTVDLDQQPVDQNHKMQFWFDCFYPIMKNRTWELTIVRIPYSKESVENMISAQFTIDSNGDLVDDSAFVPTTITTSCTTAEAEKSETSDYQETLFVPEVRSSEESNKWNSLYKLLEGIGVGIIIIILAICVGCLIRKYKVIRISNPVLKARYEKRALLLYDESSTEHVMQSKTLILTLKRICDVTLPSSSSYDDSIDTEDMVKNADIIIIISSKQLADMVSQLQNQSLVIKNAVAHALWVLLNDGELMSSRVLVVYFSEEKPLQVLQGLSIYCPLALPANLETVIQVVQDGRLANLGCINNLNKLETGMPIKKSELYVGSRAMNGDILHLQSTAIPSTLFQDAVGLHENKCLPEQLPRCTNDLNCQLCYMYPQHYEKNLDALPTYDYHHCHDAQLLDALGKPCHGCSQFCPRFKPPVDCSCIESDIDSYVDAINQ